MLVRLTLGVLTVLGAARAPAQADWRHRTIAATPSARHGHVLQQDGADVLLFGGRDDHGALLADTWTFDGAVWTLQQPASAPPARRGHAVARDAHRAVVVLFGGLGAAGTPLGDTWEWDGARWVRKAAGPPPRSGHALAFDAVQRRVLLFGGIDGHGTPLGDTWAFDGSQWRALAPATRPNARFHHRMVADPARGRIVLFGGVAADGSTWEWDGTDWSRVTTAGPGARARHAMTWDERRRRVVLVGGAAGTTWAKRDTWEWDGQAWFRRSTPRLPPAVLDAGLAFDRTGGRALLFGGLSVVASSGETWDYGPDRPAAVVAYGAGCPGTGGVARLVNPGRSLPWTGCDFDLAVEGLWRSGPIALHAGLSATRWGAFALPAALDGIGMPGCTLLASPDVVAALSGSGGQAALSLPIPNAAQLAGLKLYWQALVFDPGANALGVVASDALETTIGVP